MTELWPLPTVGGSAGNWGRELKNYLQRGQGWIDVRAYGAHSITESGYETFDSTTAIQAAEAAAASAGTFLFFPPGTYKLTGLLAGIAPQYRGVKYKSILKQTKENTPILLSSSTYLSSKTFSGLAFDASADGVAAIEHTGSGYISWNVFQDCEFYRGLKYGIKGNLIYARIVGCRFGYLGSYNTSNIHISIYSHGVQSGNNTNLNHIQDTQFTYAKGGNAAVDILTGGNWYFESCSFECLKTAAVYAKAIYGLYFKSCWFEPGKSEGSGADYCVYAGSDGGRATKPVCFDNCWVYLTTSSDIDHIVNFVAGVGMTFQGCMGNLGNGYYTKIGTSYDLGIQAITYCPFVGYSGNLSQYSHFGTKVYLNASATWNPGSIADGDEEAKEITVTGAALGDFAMASFSLDISDLVLNAQVTAANTITCILANNTGGAIDLGDGTVYVRVIKK